MYSSIPNTRSTCFVKDDDVILGDLKLGFVKRWLLKTIEPMETNFLASYSLDSPKVPTLMHAQVLHNLFFAFLGLKLSIIFEVFFFKSTSKINN